MQAAREPLLAYIPIENLEQDFRLVSLQPSEDYTANINCKVYNCSLNKPHGYEALSYVWGTEKATSAIFVKHVSSDDGDYVNASHDFLPTLNLELALRALRFPDKPRRLWIDSICIDQGNLEERAAQVRIMGRIYQQCSRDVLWLGSETVKIRRAMELVQRLVTCGKDEKLLAGFTKDEWAAIRAMIGANPVWNRVWIVQELFFAPKILLVCLGQTLDWEVIMQMLDDNAEFKGIFLNGYGTELFNTFHKSFRNITTFQTIRHPITKTTTNPIFERTLLSIVSTFGGCQATEPVDKVYGLLNIANNTQPFPISYTKSLDEVSVDFSQHVLQYDKALLALSAALGDPLTNWDRAEKEESQLRTLPTWAMDLSKPMPSATGLTLGGKTRFNACGFMSDYTCVFSPDGRRFGTSGWMIDTVDFLSTPSPVEVNETKRDRWVRDVRDWAPRNDPKDLYPVIPGETILNAYWRTVTTDKRRDIRIEEDDAEYTSYKPLEDRVVPEEQEQLPGWRFSISRRGVLCMLPPAAREGDFLVILLGAKIPYLLRPIDAALSDRAEYTCSLFGEAYIHGFMDGQAALHFAQKMVEAKAGGHDMLATGHAMLTMFHIL
jgi:hypothetical protein